jgi:hypothetical protein
MDIIKDEKGGSAVEFAIILPLLLTSIFGIIEFSLFFFNKQVITNAAREGARRGIIVRRADLRDYLTENDAIRDRVIQFAENHLVNFGTDTLTNSIDDIHLDDPRPIITGSDLTVVVKYDYRFLFLDPLFRRPIPIIGQSTMKME